LSMRIFLATACPYFFAIRKAIVFPIVFPIDPEMMDKDKSRLPVLAKNPTITYKICEEGILIIPLLIIRKKIAPYENDNKR